MIGGEWVIQVVWFWSPEEDEEISPAIAIGPFRRFSTVPDSAFFDVNLPPACQRSKGVVSRREDVHTCSTTAANVQLPHQHIWPVKRRFDRLTWISAEITPGSTCDEGDASGSIYLGDVPRSVARLKGTQPALTAPGDTLSRYLRRAKLGPDGWYRH